MHEYLRNGEGDNYRSWCGRGEESNSPRIKKKKEKRTGIQNISEKFKEIRDKTFRIRGILDCEKPRVDREREKERVTTTLLEKYNKIERVEILFVKVWQE